METDKKAYKLYFSVQGDYDEVVASEAGVSLDFPIDAGNKSMDNSMIDLSQDNLSQTQIRENSQVELIGSQESYSNLVEDFN